MEKNMNLNALIGKRVANLRKEHHMTQEQLANRLGVSVKHCSCVERGTAALSLDRMIAVCDLFDVSLDYLVRGSVPGSINDLPPFAQEIMQSEDPEERKMFVEYLESYRKIKDYYQK